MKTYKSLLIELRTEELPPNDLQKLSISFANNVVDLLEKIFFIESKDFKYYATPRRLAIIIKNVKCVQDDKRIIKKGPTTLIGLKDAKPTKALDGFIKSCNASFSDLKIINDGKNDVFIYEHLQKGLSLKECIIEIINKAIKKLPISKTMRWSDNNDYFVRPVHTIIILHGTQLIKGNILGVDSQNWTSGHRFLSYGKIIIDDVDNYVNLLEKKGKVIVSFEKRKQIILSQLKKLSNQSNSKLYLDENLLDYVTALVEWPIVLEAKFDKKFLEVPQECLIMSMQEHQKYFPLLDHNLKLMNKFLLVTNIETNDYSYIINGNEKVLRARFSDAQFFFNQDKQHKLINLLPKLKNIIYHNKIGTQYQRVERLIKLSEYIAIIIKADVNLSKKAATYAKVDLVTQMVSEFPKLQGIMGKHYALHDKENIKVANAIEQHYWPKFSKDELPQFKEATAVSLADKIEYIFAICSIGIFPTGEKDPFALRRNALAIIRILLENDIDLLDVLNFTKSLFDKNLVDENIILKIFDFILTRLEIYLNQFFDNKIIKSLLINKPSKFNNLFNELVAINEFIKLPESLALINVNKRSINILKKAKFSDNIEVNLDILQEKPEIDLLKKIDELNTIVYKKILNQEFLNALYELSTIKPFVDNFFNNIMVMTEDINIQNNRLAILNKLSLLLNCIADITLL